MTAATTPISSNRIGEGPIPKTVGGFLLGGLLVYSGWLLAKNASDLVVVVTETTGLSSFGIATQNVDSTGLADGAAEVEAFAQHVNIAQSALSGDAFTDANAPAVAYGVDNQTIAKLAVNPSTSAARSPVGIFMGINSDTGLAVVWVGPVAALMVELMLTAAGDVPTNRTIATTAPLTGGGDLTANRTLAISPATDGAAGSMSAADKTKLDTYQAGITAAFVLGVATVAANVTSNSSVTANVAVSAGTYPAGGISCSPADHTPGAPGSFILRARAADGTANIAFTGTAFWHLAN